MFRLLVFIGLASLTLVAAACGSDESARNGSVATPDLSARLAGTIPAVAPADQEAYRLSIRGRRILQESCGYDAEIAVAECTGGRFALNPPPTSEEASCIVGLAESLAVYIFCSDQGGNKQFYEVKA
jgi:hypothetical protein